VSACGTELPIRNVRLRYADHADHRRHACWGEPNPHYGKVEADKVRKFWA
jgi:hypothetical protein